MFLTEKNETKFKEPQPKMKWVILIELAISSQLIDFGHSIRPLSIPNFQLPIMQISLYLILGKLVPDQNQCFQLRKNETKFEEPLSWKEVGHIDWIGNMQSIIDLDHSIRPLSIQLSFNCQLCKYQYFKVSNREKVKQNSRNPILKSSGSYWLNWQ